MYAGHCTNCFMILVSWTLTKNISWFQTLVKTLKCTVTASHIQQLQEASNNIQTHLIPAVTSIFLWYYINLFLTQNLKSINVLQVNLPMVCNAFSVSQFLLQFLKQSLTKHIFVKPMLSSLYSAIKIYLFCLCSDMYSW